MSSRKREKQRERESESKRFRNIIGGKVKIIRKNCESREIIEN